MSKPTKQMSVESILSEYAMWAGNDITTSNFKRLEKTIESLITEQERLAEIRGQIKELDFLSSGFYTNGNQRDLAQKELAERMNKLQPTKDLEEHD